MISTWKFGKNPIYFLSLFLIITIITSCASCTPISPDDTTFAQTTSPTCEAAFQKPVVSGTPAEPVSFLLKRLYDDAGWVQLTDTYNGDNISYPFVRGSNNSDVKSLVCIEEDRTQVTYYTPSGDPAYQSVWNARLVSWPDGEVTGATTLTGLYPPLGKPFASGPQNGPSPQDDLLRWVLASLGDKTVIVQLGVTGIAFSPDGKTLASSSGMMSEEIGNENTVKLWDAGTGRLIFKLNEAGDVQNIAFSPDGKTLAFSIFSRDIKIVDIATQRELRTIARYAYGSKALAFSPDGKTIAIGNNSGRSLELWDVKTGELIRSLKPTTQGVEELAFSTEGNVLVALDNSNAPFLWETMTWMPIATSIVRGTYGFHCMALSLDGRILALSQTTEDGKSVIRVFEVATGELKQTLVSSGQSISSLAFSPNGRILASAVSYDVTDIKLWDMATGKVLRILSGHTGGVNGLAFSPDGRILASSSLYDRSIKLWDVASGK